MSLLLSGPEKVLVYTEVDGTDGDGNPIKVPSDFPVTVTGRVQPFTATENGVLGQAVGTVYRLLCKEFPAGAYARVEWQSRTWDVDGEPVRQTGSERTSHVVVHLRARRPEAA
jgi:hypothetical protein